MSDHAMNVVFVCELCGQHLKHEDDVCNSGIHVGPDGGRVGRAIRTDALVAEPTPDVPGRVQGVRVSDSDTHKVTCYLIVLAEKRGGRIRKVKPVAMRVGHPALRHDEAAIKVTLEIPESLFDAAEVSLVVDASRAALGVDQDQIAAGVQS